VTDLERFERYVGRLSDAQALVLHRVACRRAGPLYMAINRQKWEPNWRMGMAAMSPAARKRRDDFNAYQQELAAARRAGEPQGVAS
jgi:hypothetical protein